MCLTIFIVRTKEPLNNRIVRGWAVDIFPYPCWFKSEKYSAYVSQLAPATAALYFLFSKPCLKPKSFAVSSC